MKNSFVIDLKRIEIAHLDLKYLHTRIRNIAAAGRMSESMERFGQISPVIVVPAEPFGFTLMDGYIRVAALKRCAKDTVKAQVWQCSEQEAMLQVLARTQDRKWEVFEQAVLIQELKIHFQLSHGQIAGYLGKAKSFVTRRLALLDSLDDETREHIRAGTLSVWSATRVIVPLARANPVNPRGCHCFQTLQKIQQENAYGNREPTPTVLEGAGATRGRSPRQTDRARAGRQMGQRYPGGQAHA
jgi:ParB/RepB/Spo0J family partition protein